METGKWILETCPREKHLNPPYIFRICMWSTSLISGNRFKTFLSWFGCVFWVILLKKAYTIYSFFLKSRLKYQYVYQNLWCPCSWSKNITDLSDWPSRGPETPGLRPALSVCNEQYSLSWYFFKGWVWIWSWWKGHSPCSQKISL